MVSLPIATFGLGLPQPFGYKTIKSLWVLVPCWHLGLSLCQSSDCSQGGLSTFFPSVPRLSTQGTLVLSGCPWALWFTTNSLAWKGQPRLEWFFNGQSHCQRLVLLYISLGAFGLLVYIPMIENWINQLEQVTYRGLRTGSCVLNPALMSGVDWTMKCITWMACAWRREGSTFIYFLFIYLALPGLSWDTWNL